MLKGKTKSKISNFSWNSENKEMDVKEDNIETKKGTILISSSGKSLGKGHISWNAQLNRCSR